MSDKAIRNICANRKARFEYEITETYEAGMVLLGSEVKSLRDGRAHLSEAWVKLDANQEAWLMQAHIAPYVWAHQFNHEPARPRKLLLNRSELNRLWGKVREKGLTLVPLSMYFKDGRAKVEFGLGKGKKLHDKRQDLKEADAKRDMDRAMRRR